jgi:uncharacterized Zn-finger protein
MDNILRFADLPILPKPQFLTTLDLSVFQNKYACTACNINFIDKKELLMHQLSEATIKSVLTPISKMQFCCDICGLDFLSYKGMKQHVGKVHNRLNTAECPLCSKMFKNKHAVTFHIRQVHEHITQRTCEFCSKLCYNKYNYKDHVKKCKGRRTKIAIGLFGASSRV